LLSSVNERNRDEVDRAVQKERKRIKRFKDLIERHLEYRRFEAAASDG
jgi:hypothetical protein